MICPHFLLPGLSCSLKPEPRTEEMVSFGSAGCSRFGMYVILGITVEY